MTESTPQNDLPPAAGRRRELVEAAYKRIARHGFEGLRTRDVAGDAGVNISTLHYYYPTKEALIRGVMLHALQQFSVAMPREGSPRDQLKQHLAVLATLVKTNRELFGVLAELSLRAPRDEAIADIVGKSDDVWRATLERLLRAGQEAGGFDAELDVEGAAALIVAAIKGVSLPTMADFHPAEVDRVFGAIQRLLGL